MASSNRFSLDALSCGDVHTQTALSTERLKRERDSMELISISFFAKRRCLLDLTWGSLARDMDAWGITIYSLPFPNTTWTHQATSSIYNNSPSLQPQELFGSGQQASYSPSLGAGVEVVSATTTSSLPADLAHWASSLSLLSNNNNSYLFSVAI